MSAERLREAAKVVRERAETERTLRDGDPYYATEASGWERLTTPDLGHALADWLDYMAEDSDPDDDHPVFAVADAILGGE